MVNSTRREVYLVSKYRGGLGAVSEAFVKMNPGKVRVVRTVPISRPLCVITKGEPSPQLARLIAYLKTPEARRLFR
ncbi:MAG: hypothetical protein Kow00133_08260 [Amphiplicatus sp.]